MMPNSIILCEGSTDYALLQYYMQKAYGWEDCAEGGYHYDGQRSRLMKKGERFLTIAPSGGCTKLSSEFEDVLERNMFADKSELFDKIVIVTDNDDSAERENILQDVHEVIAKFDSNFEEIPNNTWSKFIIHRQVSPFEHQCEILLLIIPFDEDGAMETFLLKALADSNDYDKTLVEKSNAFVEDVAGIRNPNIEEDYLKRRRNRTKAKFDVYFSIRTPVEQFNKRRDIIRGISWEKYSLIQEGFAELEKLCEV